MLPEQNNSVVFLTSYYSMKVVYKLWREWSENNKAPKRNLSISRSNCMEWSGIDEKKIPPTKQNSKTAKEKKCINSIFHLFVASMNGLYNGIRNKVENTFASFSFNGITAFCMRKKGQKCKLVELISVLKRQKKNYSIIWYLTIQLMTASRNSFDDKALATEETPSKWTFWLYI